MESFFFCRISGTVIASLLSSFWFFTLLISELEEMPWWVENGISMGSDALKLQTISVTLDD
jgi:hypothetical protein